MRPASRTTLLDSTIQVLREALLNGEIKPKQRMAETRIAGELEVGRSTVREALRHLEKEGWLTRIPFKGTFVRDLTAEEFDEMNSMRAVLEAFAVELIIQRATEEDISSLADIVDRMEQCSREHNDHGVLALHFAFHETLCRLSNHRLLCKLWTDLASQTWRVLKLMLATYGARKDVTPLPEAHRQIVDAIVARDVALAQAAIREHITHFTSVDLD